MAKRLQLRRDTEANWASVNPTLLQGEIGYVLDGAGNVIGQKVGNGVTSWRDLPFFTASDNSITEAKLSEEVREKLNEPEIKNAEVSVSNTTGAPSATAEVVGDTLKLQFNGIKGERGETANMRIEGYVDTVAQLPTGVAIGTAYGVKDSTYTAENPKYRVYVYTSNGWVDNGLFGGISAGVVQETGDGENVVMSQKAVSGVLSNIGILAGINNVSFDVDASLNVVINIGKTLSLYDVNNKGLNVPSGTYTVSPNKNLILNGTVVEEVAVNKNSNGGIILAFNNQGKITDGYLTSFFMLKEMYKNLSDISSKINNILPSLSVYPIQGYMDRYGDVIESSTVEGLVTDYIRVKKGDVILYKGYGYSSGVSWVSLGDYGEDALSGVIDSTDDYAEIIAPRDGIMRFSTYRVSGSDRNMVLEVRYKTQHQKKINKTMVNVGHSIWWLDGTEYDTRNSIDGSGTLCRGYQTHLQEQFEFNGVIKYCYSGYSLGVGTRNPNNSIMGTKADSFAEHDQAIWTLDTITNDFGNSVELGEPSDYENATGISTYYGALRSFRDKVLSLSRKPIVVCANALVRVDYEGRPNTIGLTFEDYEKALLYVACRNGWYFVDQNRYGGINETNAPYTLYDMLHPTNFGFRIAAKPWIEQFRILQSV